MCVCVKNFVLTKFVEHLLEVELWTINMFVCLKKIKCENLVDTLNVGKVTPRK